MHAARDRCHHGASEPARDCPVHGGGRAEAPCRGCNGKGENANIEWLTSRKVSQFGRKAEENQRLIFRVAPRAGFEPATQRLTASVREPQEKTYRCIPSQKVPILPCLCYSHPVTLRRFWPPENARTLWPGCGQIGPTGCWPLRGQGCGQTGRGRD